MIKKCVTWIWVMLAVPAIMLAQADSIYRPISGSCVPGISSNGWPGTNVTTNFSFNLLGGTNARVVGMEIGSILNINAQSMTGLQIAGVMNFTGGDVAGLQIAGVTNVVTGDVNVSHIAGVGNFALGDVSGLQLAGVANVAGGQVRGLQLGGVANIAAGGVQGAQISGTANISPSDATVQLGVVDIAIGKTYTQVGVVNVAGKARGLQLGVVNVAAEQEGVPIGIVSVAGNGFYKLCLWADEVAPANLGFKMGSKYIYNIYTFGYNPIEGFSLGNMGLGLGTHIPFGPLFLDIDAVHRSVFEGISFWNHEGYTGLTSLRFTGGWQIIPGIAVTLAPTLNVWVSTWLNGDYARWTGLPLADLDVTGVYTDIWLGFSLGVQLF